MREEQPIATLIAGLGRAGWDIHWRQLLKNHSRFHVVGVIDPVAARREEAIQEIGCAAYATYDEALAHCPAELAIVATPSGGHGAETLRCLDHGWHVVVDKPMCQGVAEADAMIALAQQQQRVLTCYHPYRFSPTFITMQQILRSGRLGRIVSIQCRMSSFVRRNDWVMKKAKGGGLHNVWGAHLVDQCLQLAGSPAREVMADLQCTVTPGDADDFFRVMIRCENHTLIDVEDSSCCAFPAGSTWNIAGTRGGLIDCQDGIKLKYFLPDEAPPLSIIDGPAMGRRYGNDDQLPWREECIAVERKAEHSNEFFDNVADAVRAGAPLLITPESVRETIEILEISRQQNPHIWGDV